MNSNDQVLNVRDSRTAEVGVEVSGPCTIPAIVAAIRELATPGLQTITLVREEWERLADYIEKAAIRDRASVASANLAAIRGLAKRIADKTGEADVADDAGEIIDLCDLAAPPRNCDKYSTWEAAKAAYWREQGDPCDWRRLGAWLFEEVGQ